MFLRETLLTEKQIEYDRMLQSCNHLSGIDLALKKEEMRQLAEYINQLRLKVNNLLP